uniref:Integrase catalytic domain-containing protein n=1 Tax=Cyprinus carpio TaxID=7962 RepID=A0A8C2DVV3_CYPCA
LPDDIKQLLGGFLSLLSENLEKNCQNKLKLFSVRQKTLWNFYCNVLICLLTCGLLQANMNDATTRFRIPALCSGERGRPTLIVTYDQLEFLLELHFSVPDMARLLGVSKSTVKRRLCEYSLSVRQAYSVISDEDLKKHLEDFITQFPNSGYRVASGFFYLLCMLYLFQNTFIISRVQRSRLLAMLKAVDPLGTALRGVQLNIIQRRSYCVGAPLALWHIDGNHKLINWRIVIHGGIDGYSRKIMFLRASNNNRATTVLICFLAAVENFGLPVRVKSDKGGENVEVVRFMLEHPLRGAENTSFITGRSVHNQRIEHLCRDTVTSSYYAALQCLEESGTLDIQSEMHVFCLHYVMLPRINMHLDLFQRTWDQHPLSSEGNRSPQQLWIGGQFLTTETPNDPVRSLTLFCSPEDAQTVEIPESLTCLQDSFLAVLNESIEQHFLWYRHIPRGCKTV